MESFGSVGIIRAKISIKNLAYILHHCASRGAATDDHNSINAQTVPSAQIQSRAGQGRAVRGARAGAGAVIEGPGLAINPQMLLLGGLKFEMPTMSTTTTVNCHICFGLLSDCQTVPHCQTDWVTD